MCGRVSKSGCTAMIRWPRSRCVSRPARRRRSKSQSRLTLRFALGGITGLIARTSRLATYLSESLPFVSEKGLGVYFRGQRFGLSDVVDLAACQTERERISQSVDDHMDFRGQASARSAYGLIDDWLLARPGAVLRADWGRTSTLRHRTTVAEDRGNSDRRHERIQFLGRILPGPNSRGSTERPAPRFSNTKGRSRS
jgi:hypothetical protein